MMGWAVQYCDYPTGHLNDANFGDANGRILLTLVPTGNANEYQLTIKPNTANGNVKKLDYLYAIIGDGGTTTPYPIEAGTDESSVEDELSATFTYTGGVNTMTIQWSYPDWTGRWQCSLENLDLSALEACSGGGGDAEPTSEYCGEIMSSGNTEAAFTWETNDAGAVVITISETLGGADEATHFRGNGINIDKIKVGEAREDAATYFDLACGGSNTITLSLKEGKTLEQGTKIYVTSQIIEYATSKDGNAWPTLTFEYTYGTKCSSDAVLTRIALSAASSFAKIGESVTLTAQAKDQLNKNMDAVISFEVSPADAGVVADGKYTPAKAGAAVITAKSGEISESITIYGVSSDNLALSKPVVAGYEPGNQDELSSKMVDGDANTQWVTYADQPASVEWAYIDLGGKYNVEAIDVLWGDPTSTSYILQVRAEAPTAEQAADDEAWTTVAEQSGITINSEQFNVVKAAARYVRIHSLTKSANFFRLKEVRVFGTEWVDVDDNEKPVMVSAELVSAGWDNAVIAVAATDNHEVAAFRVAETANSIDKKLLPADGKITLTGLTASTTYNFVITAIDGANNESANSKTVAVTTDSHLTAPTEAAVAPTWPAAQVKAIYSPTYNADCNFQDWGSGTVYSQDTYGKKYALANGGYFGVDGFSLNCINMEKLHYDIWIADDATLRIVPICRNAADDGNEPEYGEFVNLKGQQWNSVDLALNEGEYAKVTNWSNVYQVKIDNAANLTIWVGNAFFYRTAAIEDNEAPTDVAASLASASYFSATLTLSAKDNSGAVSFSVLNGGNEVATGSGASGAAVNVVVPNLTANTEYNFSVIAKDDAGNKASAVTVAATTLAAPAPAPAPTYDAANVLGVFTDIYNDLNMGIQGWYAEPAISTGALTASSQAICLTPNTTASSCFGMAFAATDITAYTALEMDVYPTVANAVLDIQVIGVGDASSTFSLTANQWNHISLNIAGNEKTNCEQIGFYNCNNLLGVCFIQNVLFVQNGGTTAVENTLVNTKAQKFIENGSLFILRDGVVYTIQGAVVR